MFSLLDNFHSEKYKLKINILDGGISEENKIKINDIGKKFSTQVEFIKIREEIFKDVKSIGRYTIVAYYRFIIPDILEIDVKKAIYLDCDILVIGNIVELYEKNIDNYLLGAIQARCFENKIYFSSGVLLMNLEKMRSENTVKRLFDYIKKNNEELDNPDQDILNFVCKGRWLKLDNIWNFEIERSENKIIPDPIVLHYATNYKPWYRFYHNYYQKYYKKYLKKWPGYKITNPNLNIAFKQIIKYIPFSIFFARKIKKFFKIKYK
jgi:lipopolysaccharide biosynthesis glycosyltransferase